MIRNILLCATAAVFAGVALPQPLGAPPARAAAPISVAGPQPHDDEGRGKALLQKACAQCHGIDVAIGQPRSRDEWTEVVSRMIGNGAQLTDDEYNVIIDYLALHYSPSGPSTPAGGGTGRNK